MPTTTPLVVGITGPQGCGKSTLAATTVTNLQKRGLRSVTVSIDDFYLTHSEQQALAARHPGNPYLEHRGYPGTHDIALGVSVLDALSSPTDGEVTLPAYNKGAQGGRGDRASVTDGCTVRTPLDIVLLEGWMLGFVAVPAKTLEDPDFRAANDLLRQYDAWTNRLGALVHLDALDPAFVVDWRIEAERVRRAVTGAGLSDDDAYDYIKRFLPAYQVYSPNLRARPPLTGACLRITIDKDRRAVQMIQVKLSS